MRNLTVMAMILGLVGSGSISAEGRTAPPELPEKTIQSAVDAKDSAAIGVLKCRDVSQYPVGRAD